MIKIETLGMFDVAKVNPVITSETDTTNYQFVTYEDEVYLIANTLTGDDSYCEDVVIKAGDFLNGYLVKAWEGQNLIVDAKHITGEYDTYSAKDTVLVVGDDGKLESNTAPESGVYFSVVDKCHLTEKAVKVRVCVA